MNICMIGCSFKYDIYSHQFRNLIDGLRNNIDNGRIHYITSNCNCFSSSQRYGIAKDELLDTNYEVVKLPYAPVEPNKTYGMVKYALVKYLRLNFTMETLRGLIFFWKSRKYDIIHFDQVLRSFGFISFVVLLLLSKLWRKKVLITIHEFDPIQKKHKWLNKIYNLADKVFVFSNDFKNRLIDLKVKKEKIEIIPFSVHLNPISFQKRDQFIFYGGHRLLGGKGFDTLLDAMKILRQKGKDFKIIAYVGKGCIGLEEGKTIIKEQGLENNIIWNDFLVGQELSKEYQKSIACLIPFTSGSGRYPATAAMSNATPVICTRKAENPEYLGDLGIYIDENSPAQLADAMIALADNPQAVKDLGDNLRMKAKNEFSEEIISKRIFHIYEEIAKSAIYGS